MGATPTRDMYRLRRAIGGSRIAGYQEDGGMERKPSRAASGEPAGPKSHLVCSGVLQYDRTTGNATPPPPPIHHSCSGEVGSRFAANSAGGNRRSRGTEAVCQYSLYVSAEELA